MDVVALAPGGLIGGVVGDRFIAGDGVVGAVAVGQDEGVFKVRDKTPVLTW